jgi:anti-sigma B factor antagonist
MSTDLAAHLSVKDSTDGSVCVIRFKDAFLNYASSESLLSEMKTLCAEKIAHGARGIVVDLTAVTVMDSCGLSMLIAMKRSAAAAGAHLRLFGLAPMVRRLFVVTKLESVFDIRADESSAVQSLAAG